MDTYPVGGFFCTTVTGWVGKLIWLGQLACGRLSRYQHAGIITTADGGTLEGQPGGARPGHLSNYAGRPLLICDGPILDEVARRAALGEDPHAVEAELRGKVPAVAAGLLGTPYSALDYFALAALHLHLPSQRLRDYVQATGHLICSALDDVFFQRLGIHLFAGKLPGDVLPADLADWADTWQEKHR